MSLTKERLNRMLFDYKTTYLTDFRGGEIEKLIETKYKHKKSRERPKTKPTKGIYTLTDWKGQPVPFTLMHRPKDIIRTNPWQAQTTWELPKDAGLADAIRSRPRVVMTPGVSTDDVEPETRAVLLNEMYTTSKARAQKEAASSYLSVRAPLSDIPAPADPLKLPKLRPSYVAPEWRMDSVSWEGRQVRAHCLPTEEFWLRRKPAGCSRCDETATAEALRKAHKL